MASISLVMIVLDEVEVLERAIESVKNIVDEFIICPTGNSVKTLEIIKKYSEPHPLIFTNYVDTKNESLKLATSDYILFMDADERLIEGLQYLKEWANTEGTNCVNALIVEGISNGVPSNSYVRARLFKNDGSWAYQGPLVHETLLPTKTGSGASTTDYRIKVLHDHSHRTPESYQTKFLGYIKLLKDYLQDHPNDPRANFYLARTFKDLGDWLNAIEYYRKYRILNSNFRDEIWNSLYDEAQCWRELGEFDQVFKACEEAEKIDPRRAEIFVLRGEIYFNQQELDLAIEQFEKAASMPVPTDVLLFMNPRMHFELPRDYLVMLYDKKRNYRDAYKNNKMLADKFSKPDSRQTHNLTWLNKVQYKNIFWLLGNTPEKIWGNMLDTVGCGGVETTYLTLPKEMSRRGHNCFVFCNTPEDNISDGVYFIPYEKLNEYMGLNPEVVITSRWYDSLYKFPNAKKIIWGQDNYFCDPNHQDAWQIANSIICSSVWHRNYLVQRLGLSIDSKKINVIPLSIDGNLYKDKNIVKDPLRVIYTSNPNRGLPLLMDMWEELTSKVKGINAVVTYGFAGLRTWGANDSTWINSVDKEEEKTIEWAKKAGNVVLTGRINKSELAEKQLSSSLAVYPTSFYETFFLGGRELAAAGVPIITTKIGALGTTLDPINNFLIDKNPASKEYREEFINSVVKLLSHQDKLKQYSQGCKDFFADQPDWSQVATMWESMIYKL